MPKRIPRPRLREGVGQSKVGRSSALDGPPVDLADYDLPFELSGAGRLQWLQFAGDPMPWWTEADLPSIAHFCLILGRLGDTEGADSLSKLSRELRMLEDQLGLSPMARARMGLSKPSFPVPNWQIEIVSDAVSRRRRGPIPIDDLLADEA